MKKLTFVSILILNIFSNSLFSQTPQEKEFWVLDKELTGNLIYSARDYIKLNPGFKYTAQPGNTFIGKIDPSLIYNTPYNQPQTSFSTDLPVGSLPGSVNVSPSGAATYSIPIALPPGTAGVMPNLSIVYNSQSGDGMLGKGWTIGGFSAISRIPTTLYHDGFVDGVDFDENDRFALDGQRLIVTDGVYGTNGATYHTEIENFSEITSYGKLPKITNFDVKTKVGLTLEYGNSENSCIEATADENRVMYWLLNKVTDANGNYYTITYKEETKTDNVSGGLGHIYKEFYPIEIKYTANDNTDLDSYNLIRFYYTKKHDNGKSMYNWAYTNGSRFENTVLLEKINIYNNDNIIRQYAFNYKFDFYPQLNEIKCFETEEETLNTTKVEWGEETQTSFITEDLEELGLHSVTSDFYPGDFNGDGKSDILVVRFRYDGLEKKNAFRFEYYYSIDGNNFDKGPEEYVTFEDYSLTVGDFNADGIDDIAYSWWHPPLQENYYDFQFSITNDKSLVKSPKYSFYSETTPSLYNGDFNGNSKLNVLVGQESNTLYNFDAMEYTDSNTERIFYISSKPSNDILIGDFNGNGKSEIMFEISDIYEFDNNKNIQKLISSGNKSLKVKEGSERLAGDFNGDGKTDIFVHWSDGDKGLIGFSNGDGSFFSKYDDETTVHDDNFIRFIIGDCNGDGKDDIIKYMHNYGDPNEPDDDITTIKIYADNGKIALEGNSTMPYQMKKIGKKIIFGFPQYPTYQSAFLSNIDFNGDGRYDFLLAPNFGHANVKLLFFHPFEQKYIVNSITDGFNNTTQFNYKPLMDASVYIKGNGAVFPVMDFQGALYVVNQITIPNGIGGTIGQKYNYEGAKIHRQGKGFLGFTKVKSENLKTAIVSETEFTYHPTYFNMYGISSKTYYNNTSSLISSSTVLNQYTQHLGDKRIFTYPKEIESTNHLTNTSNSSNFQYDNNGNLTRSYVDFAGEGNTETLYQAYITAGAWLPTKPSKVIINKIAIGKPLYTRTSDFEYYPNGLLKKSIADLNEDKEITTEYWYNSYGNIEHSKISAIGEENRDLYFTYDSKNRFVLNQTNPLGFTNSKTYNEETGNILSETDINEHTTTYKYNIFGSLVETEMPNGTKAFQNTEWYTGKEVNYARTYTITQADGESPVTIYNDKLGRKIRSESLGFKGETIVTKTIYNSIGQVDTIYEPHFLGEARNYNEYFYDDYGRKSSVVTPIGTISYIYNFEDNPKKTKTIFPDNSFKTNTINSLGQVVFAEDNGGEIIYDYNSAGLPKLITAPGGAKVSINYDIYGNKINMKDSDAGLIEYTYDAFSNLITQTDAIGNTHSMEYDILGRLIEKSGPEGTTNYMFDSATNGLGMLESEIGINGNIKNYNYDNLSRLSSVTETFEGEGYTYSYNYDYLGRIYKTSYPSGFAYLSSYNDKGFLEKITKDDIYKSIIWKVKNMNALGQVIEIDKGNKKTTYKTVDDYSRPETVVTGTFQNFEYDFEKETANLLSRIDRAYDDNTETFGYDNLNRLTAIDNNDVLMYDNTGNITKKLDAGTYSYDEKKIHAVTQVSGNTYLPSFSQDITYTPFNKVENIKEGNKELIFTYGLNNQRKKTVLKENDSNIKTKYFFGSYEKTIDNITSIETEYSFLPGGAILKVTDGKEEMLYTYKDHLGSITHVTDDEGKLIEEHSYDAWGRYRNSETWIIETMPTTNLINDRGYTGHEMLTEFNLINMNGRLYDPILGRMLSSDNYVQMPDFTQNFNRYSYAFNNPLKYTDPDGQWINFIIAAGMGGAFNVGVNWNQISNSDTPWLTGLGYFASGGGIGVISLSTYGILGYNTAMSFSTLGAIPGSIVGAGVGILYGGFTNVIQGGLDNKMNGLDFWSSWKQDFKKGSIYGGVLGAIGGGIAGYYNADSNPYVNNWTGRGYRNYTSYKTAGKIGIPGQGDKNKYCYGHTSEYDDYGHGDRNAQYFIDQNAGKDGGNPAQIWDNIPASDKVVSRISDEYNLTPQEWEQLGYNIRNQNVEVSGVIGSGNDLTTGHHVSLIGIKMADKYKIFGGGTKRVLYDISYRDPINNTFYFNVSPQRFIQILILRF